MDFFKKAYTIILPVLLNDVLWAMASLIYSVVYGRMGTEAAAAIHICNTVSNMFMVVTFGMASASAIMVGNSIGQGKEEQAGICLSNFRRSSKVCFRINKVEITEVD